MRVIIAGTRTFDDYALLHYKVSQILKNQTGPPIIVSGGAEGADRLGERYADEMGLKYKVFEADWDKHGRAAGPIRNKGMAEYADSCICFWDGKSRGTKNMIDRAKKNNLNLRVIRYD